MKSTLTYRDPETFEEVTVELSADSYVAFGYEDAYFITADGQGHTIPKYCVDEIYVGI